MAKYISITYHTRFDDLYIAKGKPRNRQPTGLRRYFKKLGIDYLPIGTTQDIYSFNHMGIQGLVSTRNFTSEEGFYESNGREGFSGLKMVLNLPLPLSPEKEKTIEEVTSTLKMFEEKGRKTITI